MNYAQLVAAVQQYVENYETSFVDSIPMFVQLAEERVYNAVPTLTTRKSWTGACTPANAYLTMPAGWLSTLEIAVVDGTTQAYTYLLNKDIGFIREAFPVVSATGKPSHYAMFDKTQLLLGPTPDVAYAVEMQYFGYPESIVTATNTWLGDNFESVLLYGALREAYVNMKGEADMQAKYEAMYQEALGALKQFVEGKQRQDAYRSQQPRVPAP